MTESEFTIQFRSIDPNGRVKFGELLDLFQEMADRDSSKYGVSVRQLLEKKVTWVLRKYRIAIDKYPAERDKSIRIKTWHEPSGKLYSLRTFMFANGAGEPIGAAWTWWVLIDIESMKPIRLDRNEIFKFETEHKTENLPEDVKVQRVSAPVLEKNWRVRWEDLDVNDHTNHTVYFSWALETVPYEVPSEMTPVLAEAEFLLPVPRAEVQVFTEEVVSADGREFLHSVKSPDGSLEHARLRSIWR